MPPPAGVHPGGRGDTAHWAHPGGAALVLRLPLALASAFPRASQPTSSPRPATTTNRCCASTSCQPCRRFPWPRSHSRTCLSWARGNPLADSAVRGPPVGVRNVCRARSRGAKRTPPRQRSPRAGPPPRPPMRLRVPDAQASSALWPPKLCRSRSRLPRWAVPRWVLILQTGPVTERLRGVRSIMTGAGGRCGSCAGGAGRW